MATTNTETIANKNDIELASDHVEEMAGKVMSNDEIGYKEYLESLDIEFSPKEERTVRWKLDVCLPLLKTFAMLTSYSLSSYRYSW
jgi:hypothetical protein